MAVKRERGTSFLPKHSDFATKGHVAGHAIGAITGAAFSTTVSSIVDDVFMPIGHILGGVGFSNLFVVLSNPAPASVPSLTSASGEGISHASNSVIINAMV